MRCVKLGGAVRTFLDVPRFAVMGTLNPDGAPHLSVVWYDRRGDELIELVWKVLPPPLRRHLDLDGRKQVWRRRLLRAGGRNTQRIATASNAPACSSAAWSSHLKAESLSPSAT